MLDIKSIEQITNLPKLSTQQELTQKTSVLVVIVKNLSFSLPYLFPLVNSRNSFNSSLFCPSLDLKPTTC